MLSGLAISANILIMEAEENKPTRRGWQRWLPRRLVDEGEDVHHVKKERRQHSGGAAAG